MRILMLGWEFPPFIAGGLGTACYGLTRALSRAHVEVLFVLPKSVPAGYSGHVRLISPHDPDAPGSAPSDADASADLRFAHAAALQDADYELDGLDGVRFRPVPAGFSNPYVDTGEPVDAVSFGPAPAVARLGRADSPEALAHAEGRPIDPAAIDAALALAGVHDRRARNQSVDMVAEADRYASCVVQMTRGERFDLIHAHDWMTYPAALALARITGKPLVTHIHSTEFDRSGEHVHPAIYDIERRGMHAADRVIAVSSLTRRMCVSRYGIDVRKIEVVYNGIDRKDVPLEPMAKIARGDKIVLFLGRITMQKGPEYFMAAARRVLEKVQNVKFVVAGSGDMAGDMIRMAVDSGIGSKVLFTGFLRGGDVDRVFRLADVYVMPSVSEPFGIAPLEAIQNDVPVIISKNSGVSEVVRHALKVDFWDVDDIANKIVAVLTRPALGQTLREQADIEVRTLNWAGAAHRCVDIYRDVLAQSG